MPTHAAAQQEAVAQAERTARATPKSSEATLSLQRARRHRDSAAQEGHSSTRAGIQHVCVLYVCGWVFLIVCACMARGGVCACILVCVPSFTCLHHTNANKLTYTPTFEQHSAQACTFLLPCFLFKNTKTTSDKSGAKNENPLGINTILYEVLTNRRGIIRFRAWANISCHSIWSDSDRIGKVGYV